LTVDQEIVDNIAHNFGLKYSVKVILSPGLRDEGLAGRYINPTDEHPWHKVIVSKYLEVEEANATFWHEITHARQYEEVGSDFRYVYNTHTVDEGYDNSRYELDAREGAESFRHINVIFPF
jgi:hypothetical protein